MTASRRPTACCATGAAERSSAEIDLRDMPALRGQHNWQNACMAYGAARAFGIDARHHRARPCRAFRALPTACSRWARAGGIAFVNDSKATNADAAEKALLVLRQHLLDRSAASRSPAALSRCGRCFGRVARAYLIGQATEISPRRSRAQLPYRGAARWIRAVAAALARCAARRAEGRGGAALARLRLLRPVSQFRGARRCLRQGRRRASRCRHDHHRR